MLKAGVDRVPNSKNLKCGEQTDAHIFLLSFFTSLFIFYIAKCFIIALLSKPGKYVSSCLFTEVGIKDQKG